MSDNTHVTQEWAIRYADGDFDMYFDRDEAERDIEIVRLRHVAGFKSCAGAHLVTRTATTTFTDWETPDE